MSYGTNTDEFDRTFAAAQKAKSRPLIDNLTRSLLDYDVAYEDCIMEWDRDLSGKPVSMTEERLKIACRNKMRERDQEFPEIARWRLRLAVGFRPEEE